MKRPVFTVIIPTLNEEKFLPKLLVSLKKQSIKNFEVFVVDGASRDRTLDVAKRWTSRLTLTTVACERAGVSAQRNLGARRAKGTWLVFIDADSVLLSNFFERISLYIQQKRPKFFTTWLRADRSDLGHVVAGFLGNVCIECSSIIQQPVSPGPLTVVRRDIFERVGGYDETITFGEDHDLTIRATKKGIPFDILREVLYEHSMRRYRKEGFFVTFERYFRSFLHISIQKRAYTHMPGFVSGGAFYGSERSDSAQTYKKSIQLFERRAKIFLDHFFGIS